MNLLVIGGAGFIGANTTAAFLGKGHRVRIFDNLSRTGTELNIQWLKDKFGSDAFKVFRGDIRTDLEMLKEAMEGAEAVIHLAAQVAVTTSVAKPREDFEINALGTLNVLEAARSMQPAPIVIYASTNKVYGGMATVAVAQRNNRWEYRDLPGGVPETHPLDFHSPYGCSKGAAEQYVRDYHRIYGVRTVVMRQSCIYGARQFGIEDQGWVAWLTIAGLFNRPITIYGDGKQIRDILHVDDLVRAYEMAIEKIDVTAGKIYNIGGGPTNTLSPLELMAWLQNYWGKTISHTFGPTRPGDQPVYVSDVTKAAAEFGWQPTIPAAQGLEQLTGWVQKNRDIFPRLGLV